MAHADDLVASPHRSASTILRREVGLTHAAVCVEPSAWRHDNIPLSTVDQPTLRDRKSNPARSFDGQCEDILLVAASSFSESIFVPIMPSFTNCAISPSERPRSSDRTSSFCCQSVGASARIA